MNAQELSYHSLSLDELLKLIDSNTSGLTASEAQSRLSKFGPNELKKDKKTSAILLFLHQFKSGIVAILALAILISVYYGHYVDAGVVAFVILLNAAIGFVQEYRAEAAIAALSKLITPIVNVYRDNNLVEIPAHDLVIGDVMLINEGDSIAADARIITVNGLETQESALTGESLPVVKNKSALPEHVALAERTNMIFTGTLAVRGSATAVVVATSEDTMLGTIASQLRTVVETKGQFDLKSNRLSRQMAMLAVVLAAITFIVGFFIRQIPLSEILPFTLATLVSAIPESLPLVFMVVLTVTARRMAGRNAILRQLKAATTLGTVNVIITDKTGTLTQNRMQVEQLILGKQPPQPVTHHRLKSSPGLVEILAVAAVCNRVRSLASESGDFQGDPTEVAYVSFARDQDPQAGSVWRKLADTPFDQHLKLQACLVEHTKTGVRQIFITGAPESLLRHSTLASDQSEQVQLQIHSLTTNAMRVIAFASVAVPKNTSVIDTRKLPKLTWLGAVGMTDPERPEAKSAIASARAAGIRVIMATGDHPTTANAIAARVGIPNSSQVYTAQDMEHLSDTQLSTIAHTANVFARMTPDSKLRLAQTLQSQGSIIAMTGDGVNDAPALKGADVGVSMGKVGTDVARQASDIVLADDNFASIVAAIEEGRTQLRNMRRTSFFLVTTNIGEAVSLLTALFLGLPLPLLPKQILWLNLVGGGVTDVALAAEPIHEDVLHGPPADKSEGILTRSVLPLLVGITVVMTAATLGVYFYFMSASLEKARTAAFVTLSLMQLVNIFNVRSLRRSAFSLPFFSNKAINYAVTTSLVLLFAVLYLPPAAKIFEFVPLSLYEFAGLTALASLILIVGEAIKFIQNKLQNASRSI